jgi:hypothetical protein
LHPFWAPWAQALAGLGRIKWAKTSVDISFGGLGRSQRAKKPMLIWMLAVSIVVQAEHNTCCLLAV